MNFVNESFIKWVLNFKKRILKTLRYLIQPGISYVFSKKD